MTDECNRLHSSGHGGNRTPMARFKGPKNEEPQGPEAWPLLNELLFGTNRAGGHNVAPRPEILPLDWSQVFGRDAPRTLEIGFNRGRFLRELARAWPDHDHVGVEIMRRYGWHFANRVGRAGEPRNVRVVWADGRLVCPVIFAPGSLEAVFVNFPDPWWKRRHVKRRLVDEDFAASLHRLVRPGGRIYVKTDVPMIAAEIRTALATCFEGPTPFEQALLPLTHREVKCVRDGLPIDRFWFTRPV